MNDYQKKSFSFDVDMDMNMEDQLIKKLKTGIYIVFFSFNWLLWNSIITKSMQIWPRFFFFITIPNMVMMLIEVKLLKYFYYFIIN